MYTFNRAPLYNGTGELSGIQILKFFCALMVVQIHSTSIFGPFIMPLCRIAVPIFFIISGYFLISKNGVIEAQKIANIFIKILRIAIVATLVYFIFDICLNLLRDGDISIFGKPTYWIREFLFGDSVRVHLWYLTSYLQTLVVIYVLIRIKKFRWIFLLIPVGITVNLLVGSYGFFLFDDNNSLLLTRNTLGIAIPCVLIGVLIRLYEHKFPSQKHILYTLLVAIAILYVEQTMITHREGDIIIMTLPVAILTFIVFIRIDASSKVLSILSSWGKHHSLDIYLWHLLVNQGFAHFQTHFNLYSGFNTFLVALLTLLLSIFIGPTKIINSGINYIQRVTLSIVGTKHCE